mmetsp:Transcript_41555/g.97477  ORF Transcript_41555/g.97477 Transcript_41555/m.97477 type:complete len:114 (-) Transcript_41555:158-499(-)
MSPNTAARFWTLWAGSLTCSLKLFESHFSKNGLCRIQLIVKFPEKYHVFTPNHVHPHAYISTNALKHMALESVFEHYVSVLIKTSHPAKKRASIAQKYQNSLVQLFNKTPGAR